MNTNVLVPVSPSTLRRTIPAAATIEPTDRSMPAVAITNVIPIAITPITLAWVSMLRTLSQVGKVSGFEDRARNEQQHDDDRERVLLEFELLQPPDELRATAPVRASAPAMSSYDLLLEIWRICGRDGVAKQLALACAICRRPRRPSRLRASRGCESKCPRAPRAPTRRRRHRARTRQVGDDPVELRLGRSHRRLGWARRAAARGSRGAATAPARPSAGCRRRAGGQSDPGRREPCSASCSCSRAAFRSART